MLRRSLLTLLILALTCSVVVAEVSDPISAINGDYREGKISLDQRVLLLIDAIRSPEKLPDRYQQSVLAAGESPGTHCATAALVEIRSSWDQLSPETQQTYLAAFSRQATGLEYVSPSGFFRLHFDTAAAISDAVSPEDLDSNGIPDFVEQCASYLDSTLDYHQSFGWLLPPSDQGLGGDTLYDVYFKEMNLYGYAVPEGPGPASWGDAYSYLVLNNDFEGFLPNDDPEGDVAGAAKVTCAHEFHHAVQFAYDSDDDVWFMEMDATASEDLIFDLTNDNYQYLPGFFSSPEKSLMEPGNHAYSSFIWGIYLVERYDSTIFRRIWEGARYQTTFAVMRDTLVALTGWQLDSAFAEFAVWNYMTSIRDDGLHYGETYPYGVTAARSHSGYPVALQSAPVNPSGYGSAYIRFVPSGIGTLHLTVNGDDAREWDAYIIKTVNTNQHSIEKVNLSGTTYFGAIDVPNFEGYDHVTLVMANTMEYSAGAFFSYSASIIPPYAVSSTILTIDSAVYSGGVRLFEYYIANTSPLNDILDVTAWDDAGWALQDTLEISLNPASDSVVLIPVMPPEGTPLDSVVDLWFKVISRGDPQFVDSQTVAARTVMYRGDLDFNGEIRVDDLTYMVSFLFSSGPEPQPVYESGDYTCDAEVNVSDLTQLVAFLFQGGSPPLCNPY